MDGGGGGSGGGGKGRGGGGGGRRGPRGGRHSAFHDPEGGGRRPPEGFRPAGGTGTGNTEWKTISLRNLRRDFAVPPLPRLLLSLGVCMFGQHC